MWDEQADVVVVGYGYAGAIAALEAHKAGADTLLIEKMPDPGGISITSGGNVRTVVSVEDGFQYLRATNAGTTPDSVLRAMAVGLAQMRAYFEALCAVNGATVDYRQADGNYPFPGTETFGYVSVKQVPGFQAGGSLSVCFELCADRARGGRPLVQGDRGQYSRKQGARHALDAGQAPDYRRGRRLRHGTPGARRPGASVTAA